ncbi:MAG: hypothetical protein IJT53_05655 [Prevotella sp.]|nr:hypothetical protein [Prevotella sp.]
MRKRLIYGILTALPCLLPLAAAAQAQQDNKLTLSGSIQSDVLIPQSDEDIGAEKTKDLQTNTYVDLMLQHQFFEAGARLEYLEHPLPGFDDNGFNGWGVPNFYVKGKLDWVELTAGTYYEQFGSGFILRTYEERTLGIDNSLLGARLLLKPAQGVTLKALGGKQRRYWEWNKSWISGADAEVSIDEWIPRMQQAGTHLMLGASWVNKHESPYDDVVPIIRDAKRYTVNLPRYVNAWDVRANLNIKNWSMLAEYAQKTADPHNYNGYIFKKGSAAMLSTSYSNKGFSLLLQAKRSENMSSTSKRSEKSTHNASTINHLPAFTLDHTYALAALYPYATQLADGEWAYQAEVGYNFKRKTALGGKYGMNVKVNFSYVRAIDRQFENGFTGNTLVSGTNLLAGTDGYTSSFFKWGDQTYYQDLDITISRKLSKQFKLNLMYMNQRYNISQIQQHVGGIVHSDIFVADGMYQLSPKTRLRVETQYLSTKQDEGDWLFALAELSLAPHWMVTVSDMWNCGDSDPTMHEQNTHYHYYQALLTYNVGAHRLQAGYGRTREGINCSGGVCRVIPAQKGFTLSYNYNF